MGSGWCTQLAPVTMLGLGLGLLSALRSPSCARLRACPVQTFAFPVYPDPQCKTASSRPRALLALSPRPPWEDASGPFSEPVGTKKGAGPNSLSSMNWPGEDRPRCHQCSALPYCVVPGR